MELSNKIGTPCKVILNGNEMGNFVGDGEKIGRITSGMNKRIMKDLPNFVFATPKGEMIHVTMDQIQEISKEEKKELLELEFSLKDEPSFYMGIISYVDISLFEYVLRMPNPASMVVTDEMWEAAKKVNQ
jgi:hypothetical protein